jgi:cytochrome c
MKKAMLAAAVAVAAGACQAEPNALRGERLYPRCLACHSLTSDRVGPRHCGVLGRRAGSVAGFAYSPAMKNSRLTWDEKTLDLFLANPMKVVPGTSMTYDGVPQAADRADLIAYLKQAGNTAECAGR